MICASDEAVIPVDGPGVAFNAPPPHLFDDAIARISAAVATLPPEADLALVGIVTDAGTNAALVGRLPHGFEVQAWIGKHWGEKIDVGAGFVKTWKFGRP